MIENPGRLMAHFRIECKHGTVAGQCRCPGPKKVTIVPCPERCPFGKPPVGRAARGES